MNKNSYFLTVCYFSVLLMSMRVMSIGYTALHFKFPTVHNSLLFCSDSCRSRSTVPQPHSHEPFILLPRFTWAKVQKTSETKIGTQTIYSEITIREASIKMRETYKVLFFPFFLFVDVPAFWGGFVFLKVLRSNKREATVGI